MLMLKSSKEIKKKTRLKSPDWSAPMQELENMQIVKLRKRSIRVTSSDTGI